jgi:hypothetical protein
LEFREIKPNNRVQIELESDSPSLRNLRGIVLAVGHTSIILVSDYGELVEVFKDNVLSITTINMPKLVSDMMTELKNYFSEIYELELKLKELKETEPFLQQQLFDANFLSKFNIAGAKNRLDKSIDSSLLFFKKDSMSYRIEFLSNPNSQIEIYIHVVNQIDYPNLDEVSDVDKILRVHAPRVQELLEKCFSFATKPKEMEKTVVHEDDTLYNVKTKYRLTTDVTRENFLETRQKITNALKRLQER